MQNDNQKTVRCAGREITIQKLGAMNALRHSVVLGKLVAGASKGVKSKSINVSKWSIDFAQMTDGVISNLDADTSPEWVRTVLMQSIVQPELDDLKFDTLFMGKFEDLVDLFATVLEFNYGGLKAYAEKKLAEGTTEEESSNTANPLEKSTT